MDLNIIKSELFSAVIGDVMDTMGLFHQFLPPEIRPLDNSFVMAGYAMPVLEADCYGTKDYSENKDQAFGKMFEALDDLHENEVYVCAGGHGAYAQWGELMTTRAMSLGAAGVAVNGYSRDSNGILRLNFPTFSRGRYAQDQGVRGRVIDYRCPIEFHNGTVVEPGDLIFGDNDGVVVVPRKRIKKVIDAALYKAHEENKVRNAIENGMSAVQAYREYGIM